MRLQSLLAMLIKSPGTNKSYLQLLKHKPLLLHTEIYIKLPKKVKSKKLFQVFQLYSAVLILISVPSHLLIFLDHRSYSNIYNT